LETFKAAVRLTVFSFVLVAGAITVMGLSPTAKVEAESLTIGEPTATDISATDNNNVLTVDLGPTG
jgi:hypothetical protein